MNRTATLAISIAVALTVTWFGTYWISPMHPVLAAPAYAFSYAFAALVEVQPSIMRRITLDQVIVLSRVANVLAWSLVSYLCVITARRMARRSHSVV